MNDTYIKKMQAAFYEEAEEILIELETSLMELEEHPQDKEVINQVFRALHTLKGSGSMFGFDKIAAFAHEIESVFDLVRNDQLTVSRRLIDLTLTARDRISRMLNGEKDEINRQNEDITGQLKELVDSVKKVSSPESDPKETKRKEMSFEPAQRMTVYRIQFKPAAKLFLHGTNPINLLNELKEMGDCHVIAHLQNLPDFENLNTEYCYIFWDIILATDLGINAIKDIFIFVEDDSEIKIEIIDDETQPANEGTSKNWGKSWLKGGALTRKP